MLCCQAVEKLRIEIMENLRHLAHAPAVSMHELPPDGQLQYYDLDGIDVVDGDGATNGVMDRLGKYAREHVIIKENELYEDDHDHYGD